MSDLTYRGLRQQVQALAKDVTADAEAIAAEAEKVLEAARDTARVAEMIAAMKVAQATVAEVQELSRVMSGCTDAAVAYKAATDTTAKAAQAADQQAQATHGGINEAVQRSPEAAGDHRWYQQD